MDQKLEEFSVVLFGVGVDFGVLLYDEGELASGHFLQYDWFGEGVDEELFCVGLQGEELGEDGDFLEEQDAVFVVAFAAVSQYFETEVDDLLDDEGVHLYVLFVSQQLPTEGLHYFDGALDLEDFLVFGAYVCLDVVWVDVLQQGDQLFDDALFFQQFLYLIVIVSHFSKFIGTGFESFSEVVAEGEQFYEILHEQLEDDFFS